MECQVCKVRSSVGYCADTRVLVCEMCSTSCHQCNALIQTDAAQESPGSGHLYCAKCWAERESKRSARKQRKDSRPEAAAVGTSFEDLMAEGAAPVDLDVAGVGAPTPTGQEAGDEDRTLRASGWEPPPPWKLSFQAGLLGLGAIIFVLIFPSYHRVVLPGGIVVLTPFILLIVPIIAILWGIMGLTSRDYRSDNVRCIIGIGVACITIMLCLHALGGDPVERTLREFEYTRDMMTPEELERWRLQQLERHQR